MIVWMTDHWPGITYNIWMKEFDRLVELNLQSPTKDNSGEIWRYPVGYLLGWVRHELAEPGSTQDLTTQNPNSTSIRYVGLGSAAAPQRYPLGLGYRQLGGRAGLDLLGTQPGREHSGRPHPTCFGQGQFDLTNDCEASLGWQRLAETVLDWMGRYQGQTDERLTFHLPDSRVMVGAPLLPNLTLVFPTGTDELTVWRQICWLHTLGGRYSERGRHVQAIREWLQVPDRLECILDPGNYVP